MLDVDVLTAIPTGSVLLAVESLNYGIRTATLVPDHIGNLTTAYFQHPSDFQRPTLGTMAGGGGGGTPDQ
jgi:hypothetical protein